MNERSAIIAAGHQADTPLCYHVDGTLRIADRRMQTADGRQDHKITRAEHSLRTTTNENLQIQPRAGAATVPDPAQYKCLPIHLPLTCMHPTRPTLRLQE